MLVRVQLTTIDVLDLQRGDSSEAALRTDEPFILKTAYQRLENKVS